MGLGGDKHPGLSGLVAGMGAGPARSSAPSPARSKQILSGGEGAGGDLRPFTASDWYAAAVRGNRAPACDKEGRPDRCPRLLMHQPPHGNDRKSPQTTTKWVACPGGQAAARDHTWLGGTGWAEAGRK